MVTGWNGTRIISSPAPAPVCGVDAIAMRRNTDHRGARSGDIAAMADHSSRETAERTLHICPNCGSSLVQPTSWEQVGDRNGWRVGRRCPECEWSGNSVHHVGEIDAFDEQLELGSQELAGQLRAMEHANMSETAENFVAALANDLIGADDFAR
jgi:hypothetical protein